MSDKTLKIFTSNQFVALIIFLYLSPNSRKWWFWTNNHLRFVLRTNFHQPRIHRWNCNHWIYFGQLLRFY